MNTYLFSISSHPNAVSINSLSIKLLQPKIDFSNYDYFIITSKQASKSLEQYAKENYINIPALCVSSQSALSYETLGGKVLDVGGGYGDNLVAKIKEFPKNKKWLYLRAKVVASDFVELCKEYGYNIDEKIMYESECSSSILKAEVEDDSILIFTSPSSVKCFLRTHLISEKSKVIVIGKTTASVLPKNIEYIISKDTTIESCIEESKNL